MHFSRNEGADRARTIPRILPTFPDVRETIPLILPSFPDVGSATRTAIGNALNNVPIGGNGLNALQRSTGDDIYSVQSNSDAVFEFANEGTNEVQASLTSYVPSANLEKLTFGGSLLA
jgi:hypothetical protein